MYNDIIITTNSEHLDTTFNEIIVDKCMKYDLWKIGAYFTHIVNYPNSSQGAHIEDIFIDMLGSIPVDDSKPSYVAHNGKRVRLKCDFILPNNLGIQFKSHIQKGRVFNHNGDVTTQDNSLKIFDASRKKYDTDQKKTLRDLLDGIGWDVTLMVYMFEKGTGKSCLCFTSLQEMCYGLFGNVENDNIMKFFHYDKGGCHYFINRIDVYYTAKKHKRIIRSNTPSDTELELYTSRKTKPKPFIEEVF
jgi:hypothetical protein